MGNGDKIKVSGLTNPRSHVRYFARRERKIYPQASELIRSNKQGISARDYLDCILLEAGTPDYDPWAVLRGNELDFGS